MNIRVYIHIFQQFLACRTSWLRRLSAHIRRRPRKIQTLLELIRKLNLWTPQPEFLPCLGSLAARWSLSHITREYLSHMSAFSTLEHCTCSSQRNITQKSCVTLGVRKHPKVITFTNTVVCSVSFFLEMNWQLCCFVSDWVEKETYYKTRRPSSGNWCKKTLIWIFSKWVNLSL